MSSKTQRPSNEPHVPSPEPVKQFLDQSLMDRLAPHKTKLIGILVLFAVSLLVWSVVRWRKNAHAEQQTSSYAKAVITRQSTIVEPGEKTKDGGKVHGYLTRKLRAEAEIGRAHV